MKKLNNKSIIAMVLVGLGFSSCQKDFDPKSYAPALNIGGFTSPKEIAASNLIAHWAFNGSLVDSVTNTAGTATGTTFGKGVKGQALQGGGANTYVLTEPSAEIKNLKSFTITEWVNTPPPSNGIIGIFSLARTDTFWGNIEVFFENGSTNDDGKIRLVINNGTSDKTFAVNGVKNLFGKWVNIGVSYNGADSQCKVYVNGTGVANGTVGGLAGPLNFTKSGKVVFGCVQFQTTPSQTSATGKQDWASFLTGQIDEVRVYNKLLSDDEVNAVVKLEARGK